nr:MAG TPA: hypothetical protein [Caudoviricetes sp.]
MYQNNNINVFEQACQQLEKENYIADMLVRTLYSNDVNNAVCYRIIELFTKKVLGE